MNELSDRCTVDTVDTYTVDTVDTYLAVPFSFHWSPSLCAVCCVLDGCGTTQHYHTHNGTVNDGTVKTRVVGIYVTNDPREDSWAAAIDPTGSVLDHLQIPRSRDVSAKKIKVT